MTESNTDEIEALVHVPGVYQVCFEVTTNCNLRCVYCHFSPLERRGDKADDTVLEVMKSYLDANHPMFFTLSGDAETTLYKDWHKLSQEFLDLGLNLRTVSNFAKTFTEEELDTFARYTEILVSLDTFDADLLYKVRRPAQLEIILDNVHRLFRKKVENWQKNAAQRPLPNLSCNIVAYDLNIMDIDHTAAKALEHGFDQVSVHPFIGEDEVPGGVNDNMSDPKAWKVKQISELNKAQATRAAKAVERAHAVCAKQKKNFGIHSTLRNQFNRALGQPEEPGVRPGKTRTKYCVMPWNYMHVMWNGEVPPCNIVKNYFVGNVLDEGGPEAAFNGEKMKRIRRGLLTGDLHEICDKCTYEPDCDTELLRERVERVVKDARNIAAQNERRCAAREAPALTPSADPAPEASPPPAAS